MNRATHSLLIALAIGPAALSAQTLSHPAIAGTATTSVVFRSPANTSTSIAGACPVALRANPGIAGNILSIDASDGTGSQALNLELNNTGSHRITAAEFTVHGLTAHGHVLPANYQDANSTTKQVNLELAVAPGATTSRNLLFKGFTSITLIDLHSLTYSDGSTWRASPQQTCSVIPNRLMLVDNH